MPVQELDKQQGGLGTILGMVGGYLAQNPARKAAQAQGEFENKRQTAADQRASQELANNTIEATHKSQDWQTGQDTEKRRQLFLSSVTSQMGPAPTKDDLAKNPDAVYNYYSRKAAMLGGSPDTAQDAQIAANIAGTLGRAYQSQTGGKKNLAGADLDEARTGFIHDYALNRRKDFQDKLKLLQATQQGRVQIAQMNQAASYARTQLSQGGAMDRAQLAQGGANNRAQMSEDLREAIANQAALNAANGKSQAEALSLAESQYREAETTWRQKNAASLAAPDSAPAPGPEPTIVNYLPQSGGGGQGSTTTNAYVNLVMTDPKTGQRQVLPAPINNNKNNGNNSGGRPPISGEVKKLKDANTPPAMMRSLLKQDGYSDAEINAAIGGGAAKPSGPIQGLNLRGGAQGGQSGFSVKGIFGQ